ncbi:hypothetical protein [Veillonella sp.]|uniref:hypothetical protein n=2 Tax=Veillonella sp. TaxID=1926307 RepID=UPI0025EF2273|nr:hypothetical protein [Veillonella sp.]
MIMCISVLDSYLESYQHHLKTVSDISVDDSNNNVSCCESDILTYSFDDIIKEFCDKLDVEVIASVDAISFYDGWLNLIEFKNSSCSGRKTQFGLKRKFNDTIRYFERIVLNKCFLDQTDIQTRIILVFNPDNPDGYNDIKNGLNKYAKRLPADKYKLNTLRQYCGLLQLCNEFKILYSNEFLEDINKYIQTE